MTWENPAVGEYAAGEAISESAYYKKLQQSLKDKSQSQTMDQRRDTVADTVAPEQQVTGAQKSKEAQRNQLKQLKDEVHLSWERDDTGEYQIQGGDDMQIPSTVNLKTDARKILRIFGQKIDYSEKMNALRESYMEAIIQARHHNFFLSKMGLFKVGMLGQLLSALGMAPEEIAELKREALRGAIQENMEMMAENIYQSELTELLYGKSRKVRKSLELFAEVERQLMSQMVMLGNGNYWRQTRLIEERIYQCQRIRDEFQKEMDTLTYQLNVMYGQTLEDQARVAQNKAMADETSEEVGHG